MLQSKLRLATSSPRGLEFATIKTQTTDLFYFSICQSLSLTCFMEKLELQCSESQLGSDAPMHRCGITASNYIILLICVNIYGAKE